MQPFWLFFLALVCLGSRASDLANPTLEAVIDEDAWYKYAYVENYTPAKLVKNLQTPSAVGGLATLVGHSVSIDGRLWDLFY